jgi:hypothetical protein
MEIDCSYVVDRRRLSLSVAALTSDQFVPGQPDAVDSKRMRLAEQIDASLAGPRSEHEHC